MNISPELFASGETYSQVRERILSEEGTPRDGLRASEAFLADATLDTATFAALEKPARLLVLSEDWCGDCTDGLPVLNKIAEETGKLDLRILPRDEHLDIADAFLKEGKFRSIPTMLLLNDDGSVKAHFIERPASVTALRAEKRAAIYAAHPEFGTPETSATLAPELRAALGEELVKMRAETRPFAVSELVREVSQLVK